MRDEITDEEYGVVDTYFSNTSLETLFMGVILVGILFIFALVVVISI